MTLRSPSFPDGLPAYGTEAEARASLSTWDVIRNSAPVAKPVVPLCCPFCGTDPQNASQIAGFFIVGCDADECLANPQVSDRDLTTAWKKWNRRA